MPENPYQSPAAQGNRPQTVATSLRRIAGLLLAGMAGFCAVICILAAWTSAEASYSRLGLRAIFNDARAPLGAVATVLLALGACAMSGKRAAPPAD